jgi:hypothetical protein
MKITNAVPNINQNFNTNKVNFSGKLPVTNALERGSFSKLFDLDRTGHMSRLLFIINDNNERREAITRDIPTIVVVAMGIPVVQKWLAKRMQEKTGLVLTHDGDIAKSSQVKEWYKYDEKMTTGFDGFTKRLSEMGGNLKKIFSRLDEDTKSKL